MRTLQLVLVAVAFGVASPAKDTAKIHAGQTIFIDKMPNDLDGYLKAEMIKQKVALKITTTPEGADLIMTGAATDEERRKWHEGWLTTEKDKTAGNVEVVSAKDKSLLWAGEAGDRSLMWGSMARGGHRKVAQRIVAKFKHEVGPAAK